MAKQVGRDGQQNLSGEDAAETQQPDSHACWGEARAEPAEPIDPIPAIVNSAIVRQAAKQVELASKQKLVVKQVSLMSMFGSPKADAPLAKSPTQTSPAVKSPGAPVAEEASAAEKKQEGDKTGSQQPKKRSRASKVLASTVEEPAVSEVEAPQSDKVPVAEQVHADVQAPAVEMPRHDCKDSGQQKRKSRSSKAPLVDEVGAPQITVTEAEVSAAEKEDEKNKTSDKQPKKKSRSSEADTTPIEEPVQAEAEAVASGKGQNECRPVRGRPKKKAQEDCKAEVVVAAAAAASAATTMLGEQAQTAVQAPAIERQQEDCKDSGQQKRKSRSSKAPLFDEVCMPTILSEAEASAADKERAETKTGDKQPKKKSRSSKADATPAEASIQAEAEDAATEKAQDECRPVRGRPKKKVQEDCKAAPVVTTAAAASAAVRDDAAASLVVPEEAQGLLRKAEALEAAALMLRSAGCADKAAALDGEAAGNRRSAHDLTCSLADDADPPTVKRRLIGKVAVEVEVPQVEPTPREPSPADSTAVTKPARKVSRGSPAVKSKRAKCPQDHALTSFTVLPAEAWGCSICSKEFGPGALLFGCRVCDYDVCEECSHRACAAAAGPASAKLQPACQPQPIDDLSAVGPDLSAASTGTPVKKKTGFAIIGGGRRPFLDLFAMIVAIQQKYRRANPKLGTCLATADEKERREHKDAAMLGVFRDRFLASGLSMPLKAQMRRSKRLTATLKEWTSEARKLSEAEALAAAEAAEEPDDVGEGASGDNIPGDSPPGDAAAAPREEKDEGQGRQDQALSHILERIAEQYPKRRPAQMFVILSKLRGKTDEKSREAYEVALKEHRCALVLKQMQKEYVGGCLRDVSRAALHRLPECWALPMALSWEQQTQARMEALSRAYPDQAPSSDVAQDLKSQEDSPDRNSPEDGASKEPLCSIGISKTEPEAVGPSEALIPKAKPDAKTDLPTAGSPIAPSKLIEEYGQRARGRHGLDPRVADSMRCWLPWAEKWLEDNAEIRQKHFTSKPKKTQRGPRGEVVPTVTLQDGLKTLVAQYPEAPPVLHLYCNSEEEMTERQSAMMLAKLEKAHFGGALSKAAIKEVAESCTWLRERLEVWEDSRARGQDPEICGLVARLGEIAERHPSLPPSQVIGHVRDLWGRPHEIRVQQADALWLRILKDRFLGSGLPEVVKDAMRSIPVWGAPRLKEWDVQKDQRSQELWEKRTRIDKKPGDGDGDEADGVPKKRPREDVRFQIDASKLQDQDVLIIGGQEPKGVKTRKRCMDCHGKTIAEALATVLSGVQPLTRPQLLSDLRKGLLKIKRDGEEDVAALATPSKRTSSGSAGASKRKDQGMYRKLDGTIGVLTPPKVATQKALLPLIKLTLGDIDRLGVDDLVHYENQLGLSARRPMQERTSLIVTLQQKNTLQTFVQRKALTEPQCQAEPAAAAPTGVSFHELTEYERSQLSAAEVAFFEGKALLAGSGELSVDERKKRLKEHHHDMSQQEVKRGSVRGVLQFFKPAAEPAQKAGARGEAEATAGAVDDGPVEHSSHDAQAPAESGGLSESGGTNSHVLTA